MKDLKRLKRILYYETTGSGGGSTVSLKLVVDQLDRSRFEPVFLFGSKGNRTRWEGERIYEYQSSSLDNCDFSPPTFSLVWNYRFLRFLLLALKELIYLPVMLKRIRPDLVHINCGQAILVGMVCRRMGIPVVWHIRELVRQNGLGRMQDMIYARCATRVIAISRAVAERLPKTVESGKLDVLYNAVVSQAVLSGSEDAFRTRSGFRKDDFIVLLLGTLNFDKGYDFLAQVAGLTLPDQDIKYVLAGQIEDQKVGALHELLRIVHRRSRGGSGKLRLEREKILHVWDEAIQCGQAVFPGRVEASDALAAANVVVCPNRISEPFGRTVIEAYAVGTPVLAMAVPAFDETVISGQTGYLLKPDPAVWAEKLRALKKDPQQMAELGETARRAAEKYNVNDHVRAVCSIYERALLPMELMGTE